MYTVQDILAAATISTVPKTSGGVTVRLTPGNQLIETYQQLLRYVAANPEYRGWDVHHIFEALDIKRTGTELFSPVYAEQVCVLLPRVAHQRINSILRKENNLREEALSSWLAAAYREAYGWVGNYCGSSEQLIRRELIAISRAVMKNLLDARNAALLAQLQQLRAKLQQVSSQIAIYKAQHEILLAQSTPGALETAGFAASVLLSPVTAATALVSPGSQRVIGGGVNLLNPKDRPELSIWDKPEMFARLALQALARGDAAGAASMVGALDAHTKKATAALTAWQDGIPLAGRRAQLLIGAAAVATSIVAIGVQVVGAVLVDAAATSTAAVGTTEAATLSTQIRIGIEGIVNASSIAEEQLAEEAIETATRQAYRALLPR